MASNHIFSRDFLSLLRPIKIRKKFSLFSSDKRPGLFFPSGGGGKGAEIAATVYRQVWGRELPSGTKLPCGHTTCYDFRFYFNEVLERDQELSTICDVFKPRAFPLGFCDDELFLISGTACFALDEVCCSLSFSGPQIESGIYRFACGLGVKQLATTFSLPEPLQSHDYEESSSALLNSDGDVTYSPFEDNLDQF